MQDIELRNGDCLEVMDRMIKAGIVVDAIITDPPYGTTACKWDSVIDFDEMWLRLNKLIKSNGAIVLFGSEPFSSALRMSNIKNFRYDWIWDKRFGANFGTAKIQPMKRHEIVSVFAEKKSPLYYPQMIKRETPIKIGKNSKNDSERGMLTKNAMNKPEYDNKVYDEKYPESIQLFNVREEKNRVHPTQKPVALMEYLIKTYTNENELVLDFTMGSGTTGVACKNLGRKFIGIELDEGYFKIAERRING
jgi:site-specific DNA-methyltransferase (adenine-specific)